MNPVGYVIIAYSLGIVLLWGKVASLLLNRRRSVPIRVPAKGDRP